MARLTEAMAVIESGTQPFLLAVPNLTTGRLDAAALVERIAEPEELGLLPAPVDLAQALLRVTPVPDEQMVRAAEKLRSDAGRRLARLLRKGHLPCQDLERKGWREREAGGAQGGHRRGGPVRAVPEEEDLLRGAGRAVLGGAIAAPSRGSDGTRLLGVLGVRPGGGPGSCRSARSPGLAQ
ncbi:hypothetical protein ABZ656_51020 [Streptomyces sp. NPDC007095]|uniref:hypothetical protein n=1 Tax=Streptomyces sp. NPDC007095 TaxID=3154482 RepID=UPI00101B52AC